jgi:CheY-like chemotaxis protein
MKTILFIDDERFWAQNYVQHLEKKFTVVLRDRAIEALEHLKKHGHDLSLVILDIMMPSPEGVEPKRTEDGLSTGLYLLDQIHELVTSNQLPVVILTNRAPKFVEEEVKFRAFPEGLVAVHAKNQTPAFYLPGRVEAMIERWGK